jgi:hypothetical protein
MGAGDGLSTFCGVFTTTILGLAGHLTVFVPTNKHVSAKYDAE